VKKEFDSLSEDANIYKKVGPVLLKQERSEAIMAVDGRLEFIKGEIQRTEKSIKEVTEKSEGKRMEVC
jgi:prefoldin beta subunit